MGAGMRPPREISFAGEDVQSSMTGAADLAVKLEVSGSSAFNWYDLK